MSRLGKDKNDVASFSTDLPPEVAEGVAQGHQLDLSVLARHQPATGEMQVSIHDGRKIWQKWSKLPFTLADGARAVITLVSDITAEKQSAENEQLLKHILDLSRNIIYVRDAVGKFVLANRQVVRALGQPQTDLAALDEALVHRYPALHEDSYTREQQVLASGEPLNGETMYTAPDGEISWFRWYKTPITQADGTRLVFSLTTNITNEKQMAANAELLQHVLDLSPQRIHVRDRAGNFVLANQMMADSLGLPQAGLADLTKALSKNFPEANKESVSWDQRVLNSGESITGEYEVALPDGTFFYHEWVKKPLTWVGGERHVLTIMTDITERKRAQQLLEQRVATRAHQLELRRRVADGLRHMVAMMLNSHRPLRELFDFALVQATQLLQANAAALFTLTDSGEYLALAAYQSMITTYIGQAELWINHEPTVLEGLHQLRPMLATNIQAMAAVATSDMTRNDVASIDNGASGRFLQIDGQPLLQGTDYTSLLLVPLVVDEDAYGLLALYYVAIDEAISEEIDLAISFGAQLGLAIENTRLQEQIELNAAYAERTRIGRDLHDSVTQTLFAASMLADLLPQIWDVDPVTGKAKLADLRRITHGALAEMRILLVELRPSVLEDGDLNRLIHQLVEAVVGRTPTQANLEISGDFNTLPPDVRVALYRTAQEALNNVVKHADAAQVSIRLQSSADAVELAIRDDGAGFAVDKVSGDHLGLGNMRERATEIGGELEFSSQPGTGTEVRLRWQAPPH